MAQLFYQGHGSYRIVSDAGLVIYVDPYAGEGYDRQADIIIVTHEHSDHNRVSLVDLKEDGVILRNGDLLKDGYAPIHLKGVTIQGTPAENRNHSRKNCVGFLLEIDGKKIYGAGDTSYYPEMHDLPHVDYALLPADGIYNMDIKEASRCADLIDCDRAIPIHMKPGALYDKRIAKQFTTPKALLLEPNEQLTL